MGQKIHPVGLRVGIIRGHDSHWFYKKKGYADAVKLDHDIRMYIKRRVGLGNVSRVEIERAANRLKVNIFTARPGAIIGRGGKGIDELTDTLKELMGRIWEFWDEYGTNRERIGELIQRIVLTRPEGEAGEWLGFLPGDLAQKVDSYLRPLYDALYDLIALTRCRGCSNAAPLKSRR